MATIDKYKELLRGLFPYGKAWASDTTSRFEKFVCGIADELVRIDGRIQTLIEEADPRTTTEMISDWERMLGIPDECTPTGQTLEERRRQVRQKYTAQYGQNKMFFEEVAEFLGYEVTITDAFWSFRSGHSSSGDALTNEGWRHWWKVQTDDQLFVYFTSGGSSSGDPLKKLAEDTLICTFEKLKPAHTKIIFEFGGS